MGERWTAIAVLIGAGMVGAVVGVASPSAPSVSMASDAPEGAPDAARDAVASGVDTVSQTIGGAAVASGIRRGREPQPGDHWGGCNDARAAGTAPIYRGEPGYRAGMDGDGDGIACEPYSG